jgi:primary-amine oxidase
MIGVAAWKNVSRTLVLCLGLLEARAFAQDTQAIQGLLSKDRLEVTEKGNGYHEVRVEFPNKEHPRRTAWRILLTTNKFPSRDKPYENFQIRSAAFTPAPGAREIFVLGHSYLNETMVTYSHGTRFYDIGDQGDGLIPIFPGELAPHSVLVTPDKKVAGEVRDRGILWKSENGGRNCRRSEELVLWSTFKATNYLYIVQFGFQDEGTISFRMGSTGTNLTHDKANGHMHLAIWRLDVDLGGEGSKNQPYLVRYLESKTAPGRARVVEEPFNNGIEGYADWNPEEFTTLRIKNEAFKNAIGSPLSYDLIPHRSGSARHYGPQLPEKLPDESFTHHDFWVLPYKANKLKQVDELDCTKLSTYVRRGRHIDDHDLVVWYISSAHHQPRDEDLFGPPDGRQQGATVVLWSGFEFRPRDLFDASPFFEGKGLKPKTAKKH